MYFFAYAAFALAAVALWRRYAVRLEWKSMRTGTITADLVFAAFFGLMAYLGQPTLSFDFFGNYMLLLMLCGYMMVVIFFLRDFSDLLREMHGGLKDQIVRGTRLAMMIPLCGAAFCFAVVLIASPITGWSAFHAERYHQLLGVPEERAFSEDVSPIDLDRMRIVDQSIAQRLGDKTLESRPGLGTRVHLGKMNIQAVNGCFDTQDGAGGEQQLCWDNELAWVGPLVHSGMFKWAANDVTDGYVIVSATKRAAAHLVTGIDGEPLRLRYLRRGAYFGDVLERHLRANGYASRGLHDYSFEIDDAGRPRWVVTTYRRTIGFFGHDADGVVIVDPETGDFASYPAETAPSWVDRIQPGRFVRAQIRGWGKYSLGWLNSWIGQRDVMAPTPGMSLIYGSDGRGYWYTGVQSAGVDSGTNSFLLTDVRSKAVRRYMIAGANESAAALSAESTKEVREAGYASATPILYNINGEPTYFHILKGDDGLAKMYGFVSLRDYATVGVGVGVEDAMLNYGMALSKRSFAGESLQGIVQETAMRGRVLRTFAHDGNMHLLICRNDAANCWDEAFEVHGPLGLAPNLKWAQKGDRVGFVMRSGGGESRPLVRFNILRRAEQLSLTQQLHDGRPSG